MTNWVKAEDGLPGQGRKVVFWDSRYGALRIGTYYHCEKHGPSYWFSEDPEHDDAPVDPKDVPCWLPIPKRPEG